MKEIKLEWYVLNRDFKENKIAPFNVFNNWVFRDEAIKLAKNYYNRKNLGSWEWCEDYPKDKNAYEQFKYCLMRELKSEEWSRCEYEIVVSDLFGHVEEKVDCYEQVKPNEDIFAKYVLLKVNGTLEQKKVRKNNEISRSIRLYRKIHTKKIW